jgi:hypothetical protein
MDQTQKVSAMMNTAKEILSKKNKLTLSGSIDSYHIKVRSLTILIWKLSMPTFNSLLALPSTAWQRIYSRKKKRIKRSKNKSASLSRLHLNLRHKFPSSGHIRNRCVTRYATWWLPQIKVTLLSH